MSWIRILIKIVGCLMLGVAVAIGILGYMDQYVAPPLFIDHPIIRNLLKDYYANVSTDFFFTAITVLIIDLLYGLRDTEREKESLIFDMGSDDNSLAKKAVRALRVHKRWLAKKSWLEDGTLRGVDLQDANLSDCDLHNANLQGSFLQHAELEQAILRGANFKGVDFSLANLREADLRHADLREANFEGADLRRANLTGAQIDVEQLKKADSLEGAIMPNGKKT
jgi:hypothetical protein